MSRKLRSGELILIAIILTFCSGSLLAQIPQGHFGTPHLALEHPEGYFDSAPIVSADGLSLYFGHDDCTNLVIGCSDRPNAIGKHDLWVATRENQFELFRNAQNLSSLNSPASEMLGGLSADNLTIYFSSDREGDLDLYTASRHSVDDEFGDVRPIDDLNTGAQEWPGNLTADALTMMFERQDTPQSKLDIWMATRNSIDERFADAAPIDSINRYSMHAPWISPDGRFLLFADAWTPPIRPSAGERSDLLVAYRESVDDEFGSPVDLDSFWPGSQVNTLKTENTPSLSPDWPLAGSSLYFGSATYQNIPDGVRILEAEWITAPGDLDATGELTGADIDLLSQYVRDEQHRRGFDLNDDRFVNEADREIWVHDLKRTYFGDANLDGEFNSGDFTLVFLAGEYEDAVDDNSGWAEGDWDGDGDFTSGDFVTAFLDGGYGQGPRAAEAVPEPSTALLVTISALALVSFRRFSVKHARIESCQ